MCVLYRASENNDEWVSQCCLAGEFICLHILGECSNSQALCHIVVAEGRVLKKLYYSVHLHKKTHFKYRPYMYIRRYALGKE